MGAHGTRWGILPTIFGRVVRLAGERYGEPLRFNNPILVSMNARDGLVIF